MAAVGVRRPFAELGGAQLQRLASTKNRQNAVTDLLASSGKDKPMLAVSSPKKRSISATSFEEEDLENLDPQIFSPKRSKGIDAAPKAKPMFDLSVMPHLDLTKTSSLQPKTPVSPSKVDFGGAYDPCVPVSPRRLDTYAAAPSSLASRLSKHKRTSFLKGRSSSTIKRIDPPSFAQTDSMLPFSIDAALSGTISTYTPNTTKSKSKSLDSTLPGGWYFDIHEDSPQDEAAIIMEHSTTTLDISSDEEGSPSKKMKDDRGKENVPPLDYVAPQPSPVPQRRRSQPDAMSDADEPRTPLSDLPAEDFFAQGLDASSVDVVPDDELSSDKKVEDAYPTATHGAGDHEDLGFVIAEDKPEP